MLAEPGSINEVALWVKVKAPVNLTVRLIPAAIVPRAVIVVVPVTSTNSPVAAPISVVEAEAMSAPLALVALRIAEMARIKSSPAVGDSEPAGEFDAAVVDKSDITEGTAIGNLSQTYQKV
jgi:hypothetical protein